MLVLRRATLEDEDAIKVCYQESALIHRPWTYPPTDYRSYLLEQNRYLLCLNNESDDNGGDIVGTFCISGIVRGYFQSAYLGYEAFFPYQGKGYMTAGLKLVLEEAFSRLNLHRLEANIQPGNLRSIKLVSGMGFEKEGYSKRYLNIGGHGWKDHERWAIINNTWTSDVGD